MSRIGRTPVSIPEGVEINYDDQAFKVRGPKGELQFQINPKINLETKDRQIYLTLKSEDRESKSLYGLSRTIISNMVRGVSNGFQKVLEIQGVGYRAQVQKDKLVLQLGFSHPVEVKIPEGLEVQVEGNNVVIIKGIDKEKVGDFAAKIRRIRPVEPYKGKGIRYRGEKVRRKTGKAGKVGSRK